MEQVQFAVAQVLDSCTQVLRQHMSLRGSIGCCLCGRNGPYSRWSTVSDRLGREEVGRRLLTTIASHEGIVPPPTSASNFGRKCSRRRARGREGLWLGWTQGTGFCGMWRGWAQRAPRPATLTCFSRCPMSRPHRLWDTGQTMLSLLCGCWRSVWSMGEAGSG